LAVIGAAYWLQIRGLAVTVPPVTAILIAFAAIFPTLTILALGDRRLHFPRKSRWPTSWRRFTLAIVSGATLGVGLAAVFDFILIETTGYIASGYEDWLSIALIRTGSGLLHGFGAAMVTLGWYYLTHPGKHRGLKVAGCWTYAVLQHAIWNGSWGLTLLPGQIGSFFNNTNVTIGSISLPSN